MSDVRTQNRRVALLKVVADAIAAEIAAVRAEHLGRLVEQYREEGTKSFTVRLDDGTRVCTITLAEPSARTEVISQEAFTAWARAARPDLVREVEVPAVVAEPARTEVQLDPKAVTAFLKGVRPMAGGEVCDPDTGEVVPWVAHHPGGEPGSFAVRYAEGGREAVTTAWRSGELNDLVAGSVLPAITAGATS